MLSTRIHAIVVKDLKLPGNERRMRSLDRLNSSAGLPGQRPSVHWQPIIAPLQSPDLPLDRLVKVRANGLSSSKEKYNITRGSTESRELNSRHRSMLLRACSSHWRSTSPAL